MLDYRIITFLRLCDLMNYRATAQSLNMTQPAVTQHIQYLEQEYGCTLFSYNGRKLTKTEAACVLEKYARSAYNDRQSFLRELKGGKKKVLRIGATKSIGGYVVSDCISRLAENDKLEITVIVDNTERLLGLLDRSELDIALIEGFFDKNKYANELIRREKFIGICAADHRFAGKCVPLEALFHERLILREPGSGTRAVFEQMLLKSNHTTDSFEKKLCVSSLELIKSLVSCGAGISFVYKAVADSSDQLCCFEIQGLSESCEFNYVFLDNTCEPDSLRLLREFL